MLEEIYRSQVAPLMEQVMRICQENGIAVLADFQLDIEGDGYKGCFSALIKEDTDSRFRLAAKILQGESVIPAMFAVLGQDVLRSQN